MAFVVLSSLSQTINQILNYDQYPISAYGKQQIASLHQQVFFLLHFLEKSDKKGNSLETRIRDAANEAEDIMEHFMYEQIRHKKSMAATRILYDLRELKMVMDEINSIAREAMERSDAPTIEPLPSSSATLAPTATHVDSFTVGLDEDWKKIRNSLFEDSPRLQIIAITGMGGMGKTTLARNAYNHNLVEEYFDIRAWVTLSHDYKTENIVSHLIDCLCYGATNDGSEKDNAARIYQILFYRKYLIVFDDIWSVQAWDVIKNFLPDNNNGSRIMITTRQKLLGYDMVIHRDYYHHHHEMRFLDNNQSWILLKQKVFPNKECPPALHKIGKDIAKRCGGLPLAIVLAADVLSTTPPQSWERVAENVSAAIAEPFDKIMSSSYIHLPHHLRPCFLYMGGFPEDYEIRVSKLIKLWIGEGFIGPRSGKSLEEVAEEYLEDLVKRSLALVTKRKSNGRVKSCNVHDMIRGMCRRIAEDENSERRLSIAHRDLRCVAKVYGSTLRSVTFFQPSDASLKSLRKLRLMRVLDVVDTTGAYLLPDQVFDLFHLRYLAFGCPMEIPAAISRLQSLRILIIRPSKRLRRYYSNSDQVYLPLEIWRLPLLTVLISFFDLLPNPDGAAYVLEELLTLSVVKKLICTKELMKMIPNLRKLGITYFEDKYKQECQLQNLELLHHLEKLKLVMRADSPVGLEIKPARFPKMLRKLTLSGWRWRWEDLETVGALPCLEVLKLRDHACQGHRWVTIEEQFQSLKYLLIDASDLKVWETTTSHFPRLESLALYRCSLLSEIPVDIGEIPTLELIEIDYANEDLVECVKGIQKEQEECGNDCLQVSMRA